MTCSKSFLSSFFARGRFIMPRTCAIIPAAGRGLRMGAAKPKQFLELSGKPILLHTLETLSRARFLSTILVVVQNDFLTATETLLRNYCSTDANNLRYWPRGPFPDAGQALLDHEEFARNSPLDQPGGTGCMFVAVIAGGTERQDSVFNGLQALPPDCRWVLIHDGVRPFVSVELLENTWQTAQEGGAAIAALPATDTVKRVRKEVVTETLAREEIWLVQTPQVFRRDIILEAYMEARRQNCSGTDDAFFVERLGLPVTVVPGERSNVKVTTQEDLAWANWFLGRHSDMLRKTPRPLSPRGKPASRRH
jgi:2-C-methyl-D-erythritol 4-phosphate cytidylyltransferase